MIDVHEVGIIRNIRGAERGERQIERDRHAETERGTEDITN